MRKEIIDKFRLIYKNGQKNKIIPFLKGLNQKERKWLVPELREYSDYDRQPKNNVIYITTCLAACTKTQYRTFTEWITGDLPELMDEVLEWYCPEWFSDYYNERAVEDFNILNYYTLLRWQSKGFLNPSTELIAKSLANAGCDYKNNKGEYIFSDLIEKQHPQILNTHIWTLFETNSSVGFESYFKDKKEDHAWAIAIQRYISNGKLDRFRVLKECLLTVNRGITRELSGWFADLFANLKPTPEELITLQDELFGVFNCKFTKIVNHALSGIKQITNNEKFRFSDFINYVPVLLSSETKIIINATISTLEKCAKENPKHREIICKEIVIVFINKDETTQTKAAKLISKYGNPESEAIKETLKTYQSSILMSVHTFLKDYLIQEHTSKVVDDCIEEVSPPIDLLSPDMAVQPIESFDDLIFFLSHAFDNNDPINLDLLPEALIRLNSEITADNLFQLEIGLQKAYSVCCDDPFWYNYNYQTNEYGSTSFWGEGLYVRLLAIFFIEYCQFLSEKYPKKSLFIQELHKESLEYAKKQTYKWWPFKEKITPLAEWYGNNFPLMLPNILILSKALNIIRNNEDVILLSTPSHYPSWIDVSVLSDRLKIYDDNRIKPEKTDLELALSRVICSDSKYSNQYLSDFIDKCGLIKKHLEQYSWKVSEERKIDATYENRFYIQMNIPPSPWQEENSIYAGISDNIRRHISSRDIKYLIYSYPSIPAIPYSLLIKDRFEFSQIQNAEYRDILTDAVSALYELKIELDPITGLFLACSMLCSDKNIRNYAIEIWLEKTQSGLIDNSLFGEIIGKMLSAEWAPAKRLTDLVTNNLLGINTQCNQPLEVLFSTIILQIQNPVTNFKKILEIYNEILALNTSVCPTEIRSKLTDFQSENTLKKVVKQILEK